MIPPKLIKLAANNSRKIFKLNLEISEPNQVTFRTRSLTSYIPKIWNALPYDINTSGNLNSFKGIIKCRSRLAIDKSLPLSTATVYSIPCNLSHRH